MPDVEVGQKQFALLPVGLGELLQDDLRDDLDLSRVPVKPGVHAPAQAGPDEKGAGHGTRE